MAEFRYDFTETDVTRATDFAERRAQRDGDHYTDRNSAAYKLMQDNINGALGEIAAQHALARLFEGTAEVSDPDFNVYEKARKSFAPDLQVTFSEGVVAHAQVKMHVCYRYDRSVPPSFMFQRAGSGRHQDKHLLSLKKGDQNHTEWLVGVLGYVNTPSKLTPGGRVRKDAVADFCVCYGPWLLQDVVDLDLWRPPSLRRLRQTRAQKQCLWLSDLEKHARKVVATTQ